MTKKSFHNKTLLNIEAIKLVEILHKLVQKPTEMTQSRLEIVAIVERGGSGGFDGTRKRPKSGLL